MDGIGKVKIQMVIPDNSITNIQLLSSSTSIDY
mgnify:CR=1 FL=1